MIPTFDDWFYEQCNLLASTLKFIETLEDFGEVVDSYFEDRILRDDYKLKYYHEFGILV